MRWGRPQEEEVGAEYQELIVGHVKLGTVGLTWWFLVGSWMQSGIQGRGLGWGYKSGCHLHVNGIRSEFGWKKFLGIHSKECRKERSSM